MSRMRSHRARHRVGLRAEWAAAWYLRLKGYRVLASRYKTPVGEIDLVVRRGTALAFIEVKGRAGYRQAAEAIHRHNQSRVMRAAQHYLMAHPQLHHCTIRFDAVLIAWYQWPKHIASAFEA